MAVAGRKFSAYNQDEADAIARIALYDTQGLYGPPLGVQLRARLLGLCDPYTCLAASEKILQAPPLGGLNGISIARFIHDRIVELATDIPPQHGWPTIYNVVHIATMSIMRPAIVSFLTTTAQALAAADLPAHP